MKQFNVKCGLLIQIFTTVVLITLLFFFSTETVYSKVLRHTKEDISLQKEVLRARTNGIEFLKKSQNPDGSWSSPDFPALTGLVVYAFLTSPQYAGMTEKPEFINNGLNFIIKNAKENGGIYKEGLPNYNTAICMMALIAADNPKYYPYLVKGRRFLASLQMDGKQEDKTKEGKAKEIFNGGIGYGSKDHSDMSNTYMALESIKMSEFVESEQHLNAYNSLKGMKKDTLNWDAALNFIQRCQNLPSHNDQNWASDDPKNKGGFIYYPGSSKAGEEKLPNGKVTLRSYGSMTYAGLLSLIYADLKKDDPRVKEAYEWLKRNYTLDENPGLGQQGLFYYFNTMAKALNVYGEDYIVLPDGKQIDWRKDLTIRLVEKQKGEGFWVNDSGRWWENDPVLVTSYAIIALNIISF